MRKKGMNVIKTLLNTNKTLGIFSIVILFETDKNE